MTNLPIGQAESETLEFKSAAALERAETIARAAVAFLNGPTSGSIWVGILESNEIAVAAENLGDKVSRRRRQLEDAFSDLIEPPPTAAELTVETVHEGTTTVLRVECSGSRRPYALRTSRGGRTYVIRRGATTRPMTREEIRNAFAQSTGSDAAKSDAERFDTELIEKRIVCSKGTDPMFWLAVCPAVALTIDVQQGELQRLLTIPEESQNRRAPCWSVVSDKLKRKWVANGVQYGEAPSRVLELTGKGLLSFRAPLRILTEPMHPTRLYSDAVLEFPASLARVAARIYDSQASLADNDTILLDLAIYRAVDWTLLADASRTFDFDPDPPHTLEGGLLEQDPIQIRWKDLRTEPDRVSKRLVHDVYQAFGLDRSRIPDLYDPETGRLRL